MKKKIIVCALLCAATGFALASGKKELSPLTIYGLKGPSGVGMIRLFETPPDI